MLPRPQSYTHKQRPIQNNDHNLVTNQTLGRWRVLYTLNYIVNLASKPIAIMNLRSQFAQ